ncbi:proteasome endopeptidase complex, beta subunit [Methanosalsum zhilinae DSM 4017]|uniref:Proteasome subunit beta n=1 Tax=Methanosalsum zhilinae (strain DSM 4017 / NBRC 107636 / OCM 62 / WeN5) TaxID=679901 RepID=F7XM93_METZD|nr:archaeal proteasome endopeptidase complex subunit beta [Methanosalsum zhilinae]AEH60982.1 proteasome endopeptidase complex, beta subunit [Methanosalsum zhilinae DSM 4017]
MVDDKYLKGTTTVGIVCRDGVVLATEKRATMGNLIASKTAKKIYQIDDLVGLTTAGSVGDAQQIVRLISVESRLYKMRRQETMTIKGITTLLSNLLSGQRYYPLMVQLLIGGVDKKGPNLYSLDALGGMIEETNAVATGSGSPIAYGVLEDRYHTDMSIEEGADLAIRALHNAMKRDSASGNGIDVVCITDENYMHMEEDLVNEKINSLN